MREIIFRGKMLDVGAWVMGDYTLPNADNPDRQNYKKTYIKIRGCCNLNKYEVDPETVGQYTGLKDKNGKMIFEGDIIHYDTLGPYSGPEYYIHHVGPVIFSDQCFLPLSYCVLDTLEVVGNIYDNPEMCKEARHV